MASFAMGPWLAAESHQQNGAHYSWTVRTQSRFFMDASIIYPEGDDAIETLHATARLIAAAPDLYEALSGLFGLLQMIGGRADIAPELRTILVGGQAENHRITAARAALAKVTPQAVSENGNVQGGSAP